MAIASKEQERKALDKIRKIVAELGEDSYIATAFEGCFDDAEENIENDFAMSMNGRWQDAEQKVERYRVENEELKSRIEGLEKINSNLNKHYEQRTQRIDELNKQLEDAGKQWTEMWNAYREQQDKANALEQEVIVLKAKLYDLLCK